MNSTMAARLGLDRPIIQAPMAGISTPRMAAAAANHQVCARWRAFDADAVHCAVARAAGKLEEHA